MRKRLQPLAGQRLQWRGIVMRFGDKFTGLRRNGEAVCVGPVYQVSTGEVMAGHVWLSMTATLRKLQINVGDVLTFDATVTGYWKGYHNPEAGVDKRQIDYNLTMVANVQVKQAKAPAERSTLNYPCLLDYVDLLVGDWVRLEQQADALLDNDRLTYQRVKSKQIQVEYDLAIFIQTVLRPMTIWSDHKEYALAQLKRISPALVDV